MEREFKFELGLKAKCKVTGFKGVIDARSESLNGCHRYSLHPGVGKDGKLLESYWFDELSLDITDKKPVVKHTPVKTGGPISKYK